MGLLWKFRGQNLVQGPDNRDIGSPVVGRGFLEAIAPGCLGCGPPGVYVRLGCHCRRCLSFGSLSGNTIQGSWKSACSRSELFFGVDREVEVFNLAYHPNDNLLYECPDYSGYLSTCRNPQHTIRTAQLLFQLHVFADYQTMGTIDDRLVLRYRPLCIHLFPIWPGSPRVASPPALLF